MPLSYIDNNLVHCGIEIKACIVQVYDGTSIINGTLNGMQSFWIINVKLSISISTTAVWHLLLPLKTLVELQISLFLSRTRSICITFFSKFSFSELQKQKQKTNNHQNIYSRIIVLNKLSDIHLVWHTVLCLVVKLTLSITIVSANSTESNSAVLYA